MVAKRKAATKLAMTVKPSKGSIKASKGTVKNTVKKTKEDVGALTTPLKASKGTVRKTRLKATKGTVKNIVEKSKVDVKVKNIVEKSKEDVRKTPLKSSKGTVKNIVQKKKEEIVDPRSVGMDPTKIKEYEDEMEMLVKEKKLPGCASMVYRYGKLIQCRAWGHTDIEKSAPFDTDTLCRVICATKCVVSICVMTLVDDGSFCLDDPVHKYIPAFKDSKVVSGKDATKTIKLKEPILVKHLLSHMSGIDYVIEPTEKAATPQAKSLFKLQQAMHQGKVRNLQEFVDELATIPLSCQPGKKYTYSYSYDVLARIIEIICGKSLDKCLEERVLQPLGMQDTMWGVPEAKCHRLSPLYAGPQKYKILYSESSAHSLLKGPGRKPYSKMVHNGKGMVEIERGGKDSMYIKGRECPILSGGGYMGYDAGGLVSTVSDFAKMLKMMFSYGLMDNGKRLVQESTVRTFEINRLDNKSNGVGTDAWDYQANGVCYIGNIGTFREGHSEVGMGGAANTFWNIDREIGTASVWFAQHLDFPEFTDLKSPHNPKKANLWDVLHDAIIPEAKVGSTKRKRS